MTFVVVACVCRFRWLLLRSRTPLSEHVLVQCHPTMVALDVRDVQRCWVSLNQHRCAPFRSVSPPEPAQFTILYPPRGHLLPPRQLMMLGVRPWSISCRCIQEEDEEGGGGGGGEEEDEEGGGGGGGEEEESNTCNMALAWEPPFTHKHSLTGPNGLPSQ